MCGESGRFSEFRKSRPSNKKNRQKLWPPGALVVELFSAGVAHQKVEPNEFRTMPDGVQRAVGVVQ
jgi:hypothetical protein